MSSLCQEIDGEIQCHVHPTYIWLMMVQPVLILCAILLVLDVAYFIFADAQKVLPWQFPFGIVLSDMLIAIAIMVPSYIWIWLDYMNFVYIIRKDELVIRKGIIQKRHNSIPYNKIRNVQRLQSVIERLFNLCTISIETAGISTEFPDSSISGIRNSKELPEIILKKMHVDHEAETSLAETMRQILAQLKDLNRRDQREEDRGGLQPKG